MARRSGRAVIWATAAWASPDAPLTHADEVLVERRFSGVTTGQPAKGRGRNKAGAYQAWQFPDGTISSWYKWEKGKITELKSFDGTGRVRVSVQFAEGRPTTANVLGIAEPLDLSGWVTGPPVALWWPVSPIAGPHGSWVATTPQGRLMAAWGPPGDPRDPSWTEELQRWCACRIQGRTAAWAQGVSGVKFRAFVPHVQPAIAELWVFPQPDRVLLLSWVTADPGVAGQEAALAPGRVAAALMGWAEP